MLLILKVFMGFPLMWSNLPIKMVEPVELRFQKVPPCPVPLGVPGEERPSLADSNDQVLPGLDDKSMSTASISSSNLLRIQESIYEYWM